MRLAYPFNLSLNGIGLSEEMALAVNAWNAALKLDPGNKTAEDYKYRAEAIMERLKEIKEKQARYQNPAITEGCINTFPDFTLIV